MCCEVSKLEEKLQTLPPFEKEPWTHFKATLTEDCKFRISFSYIPQENSWLGLFMKGVSQLSREEAKEHHIPEDVWRHRQQTANLPSS